MSRQRPICISWNSENDEIIFDNYLENSPNKYNNSFFGLLHIRETSHKEGMPECQKSWWGQAYAVGVISSNPYWNSHRCSYQGRAP